MSQFTKFSSNPVKKAGDRIDLPGGWYLERYNEGGVYFSLRRPDGRGFGIDGTGKSFPVTVAEEFAAAMWQDAALGAISAAIGTTRFMDPPDGGDVSLAEQVKRMREALDTAESSRTLKPLKWRHVDFEYYRADTVLGAYDVSGHHWHFAPSRSAGSGECDSLPEAQAAAQAHHENLVAWIIARTASPGAAMLDVSAPGDADPPRPNQPQVTE